MKLDTATEDRLRELGYTETQLKLIRNIERVQELLSYRPLIPSYEGGFCPECDVAEGGAHERDCRVLLNWEAIGDPRFSENTSVAEDEARRRHEDILRTARNGGRVPWPNIVASPHMKEGEALVFRTSDFYDALRYASTNLVMPRIIGLEAQLREQTTLDDAPAVDDGHGLDVDDP